MDGAAIEGLVIRAATPADVPALAALFADDPLGGHGDSADPADLSQYQAAFARIAADAANVVYVAELDGAVAGTFQTILIATLSGRGASSLIIAAVQTRADLRGRGIGAAMMRFAIARGREIGVRLVQVTSSNLRHDAHRFYRRLGFVQSHAGFKMKL